MIDQFMKRSNEKPTKRTTMVLKCPRSAFPDITLRKKREAGHDCESALLIKHHSWLRRRRDRREDVIAFLA
jgi:hypothetical protein